MKDNHRTIRRGQFSHKRVLPEREVSAAQLKSDLAAGVRYFWSRRPHLQEPGSAYLDFSRKGAA